MLREDRSSPRCAHQCAAQRRDFSDFLVARKFAAVGLCDGKLQIFDLLYGQLVLRRGGSKPQQQFACHVLAFGGECPHGLNSLIQQRRHRQNNSIVSRTRKCCTGARIVRRSLVARMERSEMLGRHCQWQGGPGFRGVYRRAGPPGPASGRPDGRLRPDPVAQPGLQLYELVFGCGVPMYGNALRMSVCGLRPLLGISPFERNARR